MLFRSNETESTMNKYIEIESYDALSPLIVPGAVLRHYAFQNIEFGRNAVQCRFEDCIFFGCSMPDVMRAELAPDCCVLPQLPVPFNPFPAQLSLQQRFMPGMTTVIPKPLNSAMIPEYTGII